MRILVVGDIHGNSVALKAVLDSVRGWDEVLVLGDLVDYGPDPAGVIDILREIGAKVLTGNHDYAAVHGVDCRASPSLHEVSVWFRRNVTLKLLSRRDLGFLASLPISIELDGGALGRILAVHASPRDPLYEYLDPAVDKNVLERVLPRGYELVLVGHTHRQFLRRRGRTALANPGSVGQPRDGDPRASYALLDTEKGTISFGRVEYNVEAVIRSLESIGLPRNYLERLISILRGG